LLEYVISVAYKASNFSTRSTSTSCLVKGFVGLNGQARIAISIFWVSQSI